MIVQLAPPLVETSTFTFSGIPAVLRYLEKYISKFKVKSVYVEEFKLGDSKAFSVIFDAPVSDVAITKLSLPKPEDIAGYQTCSDGIYVLVRDCHIVIAVSAAPGFTILLLVKTPNPPPSKSSSIKYAISVVAEAESSIRLFSPQTSGTLGVKVNVVIGFIVALIFVLTKDSQRPLSAVT